MCRGRTGSGLGGGYWKPNVDGALCGIVSTWVGVVGLKT
jgi:hypothetical protein